MKKSDLVFVLILAAVFLPFLFIVPLTRWYHSFNTGHGMIMSFLKFAVLATLGELLGQRIKSGKYLHKRFGILPRALVWGIIGLSVKMAFIIFTKGTVPFLVYLGFTGSPEVFAGPLSLGKVGVAFCISAAMNCIYAPLMMAFHRITDTHIMEHGGSLRVLLRPIPWSRILQQLDWKVQWHFVYMRTIPFFWIPAHTLTFLMPESFQVLFAALLSIALGVILALAGKKRNEPELEI